MNKLWLLCLLLPTYFAIMRIIKHKYIYSMLVTLSCLCFCIITRSQAWYYIALGFVFSIIGDYFLAHIGSNEMRFIYGVSGFFLAHACFCLYSMNNIQFNPYITALTVFMTAAYLLFMYKHIYPHAEGLPLKIAITMYMLISITAFALALSSSLPSYAKWTFVLGIALIMFSDTLIGIDRFMSVKSVGKLILPTYYLCHILLAASTFH